MAKLIKVLENVRKGGQGFGFTARHEQRPASLVLVVASEAEGAVHAADAGADAVAFSGQWPGRPNAKGRGSEAPDAAATKPRGLVLGDGTVGDGKQEWGELGIDFVVLGDSQPATVLLGEVERMARVEPDFDPTEIRALEALGMDGFVLAAGGGGKARLSVRDLTRIRLLVGVTGKPVLVSVGDENLAASLEVLVQAGVEGVLLEGEALTGGQDAVARIVSAYRQAIDKLGPRRLLKRRAGEDLPIIPRAAPEAAGVESEPEEPGLPE